MTTTLLIPVFPIHLPVQFEDDGAVHDGETQQANPPQEDTSKHTGMEVQDHHLQRGTAVLVLSHTHTHWDTFIILYLYFQVVDHTHPLPGCAGGFAPQISPRPPHPPADI